MDLRVALENDEFFLVYQPTFDLQEMTPTGMEALIRWRQPERGVVQPDDFIPLLEETGLIMRGRHAGCSRRPACRARAGTGRISGRHRRQRLGRQLDSDEFVAEVARSSPTAGSSPAALTIEITETTLMRDAKATAGRLSAVKALGVRIAIDDFGTGYSSLAYLQRFPVDALKIDRSFISQIPIARKARPSSTRSSSSASRSRSRRSPRASSRRSELSLLKSEHCDSGQGFLFARPLDVAACDLFLADWTGGAGGWGAPRPRRGGRVRGGAASRRARAAVSPGSRLASLRLAGPPRAR